MRFNGYFFLLKCKSVVWWRASTIIYFSLLYIKANNELPINRLNFFIYLHSFFLQMRLSHLWIEERGEKKECFNLLIAVNFFFYIFIFMILFRPFCWSCAYKNPSIENCKSYSISKKVGIKKMAILFQCKTTCDRKNIDNPYPYVNVMLRAWLNTVCFFVVCLFTSIE